jgi:peptidoglycan hydrolase CwlO-like protein
MENQKNIRTHTPDVFDKLSVFEEKHRAFINLVLKPLIAAIVFLCIGYYTSWLSTNYVKKELFEKYIDRQDKIYESRFEITSSKLETIISQQITFSEQFKSLNMQISSTQKNLDNINERITYLERLYYRNNKNNE